MLVVEPVRFGSQTAVLKQITTLLRARVAHLLARSGAPVVPDQIIVHLFGANL